MMQQQGDIKSNQSEKDRVELEKVKEKYQLDDTKYNILLQMLKKIREELDTNADFQGQNRAKVTDVKHLIRQLNARDFNLDKTMEMWRNWLLWRKQYEIDNINLESLENEFKTGKAFWHKYDKEGNPCCVVRIKNHIAAETTHEKVIKFMIYLMEVGIKMCEKSGTEKMSVIWDREGFSSKNFDFSFIALMKSLVSMFQDNYAERLAHVFILYPSFIMRQAFNIFRPLLAEKVRNKITIVNELKDLKKYFEDDNILKIHGGKSDFEYRYPDNILCDPLNAVLPYMPNSHIQNRSANVSFSFQNHQEQGDDPEFNNQQLNRSSCFYSIENDSTEFFNIQNSQFIEQQESEYSSQHKSQSNKFKEEILKNQQQQQFRYSPENTQHKNTKLNRRSNDGDNNGYQEDEIENDTAKFHRKPIDLIKQNHQNSESNEVITSSGCCGGCRSGSSCAIF